MTDTFSLDHADLKVSAEKVVRRVSRKYIRTPYHPAPRSLGSGIIIASFYQIVRLVKCRIQLLYRLNETISPPATRQLVLTETLAVNMAEPDLVEKILQKKDIWVSTPVYRPI